MIKHAIAINPRSAVTYYCRGNIYYEKGDYEKARTDFNRAIALNSVYENYIEEEKLSGVLE